jgi:hypothetical protein
MKWENAAVTRRVDFHGISVSNFSWGGPKKIPSGYD